MRSPLAVRTLLLVLLLAVLPLGTAFAQTTEEYVDQLIVQLQAASEVFVESGYTPVLVEGGALNHQTYQDFEATFPAGELLLMAVCDEDCPDIDLALSDLNGQIIAQDETEDAYPIVEVEITQGGTGMLRVTMYQCDNDPCYYAVGLFRR